METIGGVLAALASCATWAISTAWFQRSIRDYGAFATNLFKAAVAGTLFLLVALGRLTAAGPAAPGGADTINLMLSGMAGLALGDWALFAAMPRIGPRLAMLVQSTFPVFLMVISFFGAGPRLTTPETMGVLLVVGGVMHVIALSRRDGRHPGRDLKAGIALGLLAAVGQAVGILLAHDALSRADVVWGAALRLHGATLGLIVLQACRGRLRPTFHHFGDRTVWRLTMMPTLLGTFGGIFFMTLAIALGKPAVTGALISLTPVFMVPVSVLLLGERFDWRVLLGTTIATAGVILVGF